MTPCDMIILIFGQLDWLHMNKSDWNLFSNLSAFQSMLTQDVNKCEKNMEIEKIIFSWHVAWRIFIQIHEKWPILA